MATEKIIMVDRIPEKLSEEDMKKLKNDYAKYCKDTYDFIQSMPIHNKDAKDITYQHMLSPFQYFLEDRVRILRDNKKDAEEKKKSVSGTYIQKFKK